MDLEEKYIQKYIDEKVVVSITTTENYFYEGVIEGMSKNSIQLKDKFEKYILLFLNGIKIIKPAKKNNKRGNE